MKRWRELIWILALVCLWSCDKAPRGIIQESDMVDLVVDLHKADAYVENYPSQFPNDSTKMLLKQSVFKKHGVTQADYDTSLVWYAHNMDVYSDVYRRVIDKLKSEYNNDGKKGYIASASRENETGGVGKPYHSISGDSADLWTQPRSWILPHGLQSGYIPFNFDTDKERLNGDCFELKYKSISTAGTISALLAVDYSDGGTAYIHRSSVPSGWNKIVLQSDSMRTVHRVYGYFNYRLMTEGISYIDSVQVIRTHLSRATYSASIGACRMVERSVKTGASPETPSTVPVMTAGTHFTPPAGLHKSRTSNRVEPGLNSSRQHSNN